MYQNNLRSRYFYILLCIISTGIAVKPPTSSNDVKNFYKKFVMDPRYHSVKVLQRKTSNHSYLEPFNESIEDERDISTTPFNSISSTVNSFGPLELYKPDKNVATPIDVYSRKKMLNQISATHADSEMMPEYYYVPSEESVTTFPQHFYDEYEIVHDTPMYVAQIPRPMKAHPRPYDWENYHRRPKLQELPPSYVIVGSPVPDPPEKPKKEEPVRTEEDKISDYEKDFKVSPSGINKYLQKKLKFEVDWVTIAKILLKLIIFKKIVKFIIILGLLLFVPKYYKWSNTFLSDDTTTTTSTPPYYYDKWDKWDKFHKYKYPRRKRTTTTSTTTTTTSTTTTPSTTTSHKNCDTTTTTPVPTTTQPTTTTTTTTTTSSTTIPPWCRHHWCMHNRTTVTPPLYLEDYQDESQDDDIYVGDPEPDDEFENKDLPVDLPEEDERNEYTTDEPNFYDTFRAVADAHSLDPQRLADISLFLTQAFEAWTFKSLICYGEEDLHCRFFFMYDIMDRNYTSRSLYNFFVNYWNDWWTRRAMANRNNDSNKTEVPVS